MNGLRRSLAVAVIVTATAAVIRADVVVLKGGTVVPLKQAWVRRGNTAYLTRADGTLLSVPVSEIDREATARANQASAPRAPVEAPPGAATPDEAARAARTGPKASVRITDADVSHPLEYAEDSEPKTESPTAGGPRVELEDYTQEKNGAALVVKGSLRNPGQGAAENVGMTVTAVDDKGQSIDAAKASLSRGVLEPGNTVDFVVTLPNVGDKVVANLRFNPQWTQPKPPPAPTPRPGTAAAAAARPAAPAPRPTPYGQGTLYAAPVANAPSQAPADGKTGYIPGASSPDNQPKPPNR